MANSTLSREFVVLGAGAVGSAATYHLARRGRSTTLVEQFEIGHNRGSSHGSARIIRHSYADPLYAGLMPRAFEVWRALEADAGRSLYIRTGGVSICPPESDYVARVAVNLAAGAVAHRRMSGAELRRAVPQFQTPDHHDAVFEPDAGMLLAADCLAVELQLARAYGGDRTTILDRRKILRIDLEASRPTLVTDAGTIVADKLIVAAGAWVARLLPDLPVALAPTRQWVTYFRPEPLEAYAIGRFPVFIAMDNDRDHDFYGMPAHLGVGVKVARHGGPLVDPDQVDREVDDSYRDLVRAFLRQHLPALAASPIDLTETCLYTMSPDEHFRVDFLEGRTDVIVASPCSGHGFKFSCLIGAVAADLAETGQADTADAAWKLGVTSNTA